MSAPRLAVILAAGKGTRMRSARPKVLHPVAGRPMLGWVLDAARAAGCTHLVVVVGHGAEAVREAFPDEDVTFVVQEEQKGTGHALQVTREAVQEILAGEGAAEGRILVLSGDVPLVSPATLDALASAADGRGGSLAVATLDEPGALGRVLDDDRGHLERIVEARDASPEELAVCRINAGLYALPAPAIFEHLAELGTDNAQGELYLTDAVGAAARSEGGVAVVELEDPAEAWGVNDRADLAKVHRRALRRQAARWMAEGVTLLDPEHTVIEAGVELARDTVLHPGVSLLGATRIGEGCELHQGTWVKDSRLEDRVVLHPYSVLDGAHLETGAQAGPFARLRPGARLGEGARIGNFVEVKNARLGPGAKAGHLAYLGDAAVGAEANIGAGVVTCNYDGQTKHRTEIGEGAFVGSDTMLVAPVTVGAGASTGAGSTITQNVPPGALGVGRARQKTIEGWAERRAKAAERRAPEKKES